MSCAARCRILGTSPADGSDMNRRAVRRVSGLAHRFGHGRMRVDGANQLFNGAFQPQRQRGFGDQLGGARADDVNAEDLVVLLVGDDLDEAFRLAGDARACERPNLKLPIRTS